MKRKMPKDYGFKAGDRVFCKMYGGHEFTYKGIKQYRCPHCGCIFSPGIWQKQEK